MNESEMPPIGQTGQAAHTGQAGQAGQPAPAPTPPSDAARPPRSRTRSSPIVWGCIFLLVCVLVVLNEFAPQTINLNVLIPAVAIGLGVLLLVVSLAVIVRNTRAGSSQGTQ